MNNPRSFEDGETDRQSTASSQLCQRTDDAYERQAQAQAILDRFSAKMGIRNRCRIGARLSLFLGVSSITVRRWWSGFRIPSSKAVAHLRMLDRLTRAQLDAVVLEVPPIAARETLLSDAQKIIGTGGEATRRLGVSRACWLRWMRGERVPCPQSRLALALVVWIDAQPDL